MWFRRRRRVIGCRRCLLDFLAEYEVTSTTALSDNATVSVPLLAINGWIVMQRKVAGSSVSFKQNWAEYRDGFGSATDNDSYWLGLEKVYRLRQLGNLRLRIEVRVSSFTCCPAPHPDLQKILRLITRLS